MSNDLTDRVISVIAKTQRIPKEKITPESTFEELGLDSLDSVNILFALEEEFQISIPDEDTREIRSVAQMIEGIGKLVAASGGAS
ncbi:MAG: acyl carrier protein [Bryobacteraceae bacterium]|nr:acyl carrier protein [Bryobacteraceae bacterium]